MADGNNISNKIYTGEAKLDMSILDRACPPLVIKVINLCTKLDPMERPTAEKLVDLFNDELNPPILEPAVAAAPIPVLIPVTTPNLVQPLNTINTPLQDPQIPNGYYRKWIPPGANLARFNRPCWNDPKCSNSHCSFWHKN